jgi:hypothetical protein
MIELQRCFDATAVAELTGILELAGIPYRLGSDAPVIDISSIGTGNTAQVIVSVAEKDYETAREAMEQDSLKVPLPANHYLLTSSDEELAEVLAQPGEWSAYDVAHSRRLLRERGINPAMIAAKQEARKIQAREGKPASKFLLGVGWLGAILGGYLGVAIGWALCYSKENTPDGTFHTFDAKSRAVGRWMFPIACITTGVSIIAMFLFRFE